MLEIRETAAGNFSFGKEENSRQIRKKQPLLYIVTVVFITDDLVYLNLIANPCVMPFHSYFLFVYLIDPEARTYTV